MIQSCFSQPNTTSDHHDHPTPTQNLVTCVYHTSLGGSPTHLTLTWAKTLASHTLTLFAPDVFSVTVPLIPAPFSLFRPASKSVHFTRRGKLRLHWDFTRAEFRDSAEPESGFHLVLVSDVRVEFFLCGSVGSASRADPSLLSRREHAFGRGRYVSRAVISGSERIVVIECSEAGTLRVRIDDEVKLVVRRLVWKFRGNERILVDGVEVEFFWDVFSWVKDNGYGHGVFVFLVGDTCGVWPEMVGPEKRLLRKSISLSTEKMNRNNAGDNNNNNIDRRHSFGSLSSSSSSSVLRWAEESSEGGSRSSCSSTASTDGGFSLMLYAWRKD